MDWPCKICKFATSTKEELMKHYRLRHIPSVQPLPCPYLDCFCSFKSWGSLKSHRSRKHSTHSTMRTSEILSFCCQFCNVGTFSTEKEYFEHLLFFSINQDNTVEKRREIAIRCLIVYLGEKEEDLFKQYSAST